MKKLKISNAIVLKELISNMKKPKLIVIVTIVNSLIGLAMLFVIGIISLIASSGESVGYGSMLAAYIVLIISECLLLLVLVPALTSGTISGERERQTLEVLLTTKMSTWEIIKGKYFSSMLSVLYVILATIPFMALVFIYGGINFIDMLLIVIMMITSCMFFASFGVFFSTLTKKTLVATVLTYISVLAIIGLSISIVVGIFGVVALANEYIVYNPKTSYLGSNFIKCGFVSFILWLNPAVTLFDGISNLIGFEIDGSSFAGMKDIIGGMPVTNMTDRNILLRFWTPISIAVQMAVTYGILRWSAALLNPTRGNAKRMKRAEKMIAEKKSKLAANAQATGTQSASNMNPAQNDFAVGSMNTDAEAGKNAIEKLHEAENKEMGIE